MAQTVFHFVRHGKVENPKNVVYERLPGYHLSELGRQQIERTATYLETIIPQWKLEPSLSGLKEEQVSKSKSPQIVLFASPLERTMETAEIIGRKLGLPTHTDNRLIEALNIFRGRTFNAKTVFSNDYWAKILNPFRPSWGEPYREISKRMINFVFEKANQLPGFHVIAVSHESPIYLTRRQLSGRYLWHNPGRRMLPNGSITSMVFDNNANDVISVKYYDAAAGLKGS
jgi:broad specificity phosphatase PhoE